MESGDFWTKRDVLPESGVVGYHAPFSADACHATYFFVRQIAEDVEENFIWEFFYSLEEIKKIIFTNNFCRHLSIC